MNATEPARHETDPAMITTFMRVVFGYCDGLIPARGFVDKGQGFDIEPATIWITADDTAGANVHAFAARAADTGLAVYVVLGTVAKHGQASATDVRQMQAIVVDLDSGDIAAKQSHLTHHLGRPTMVVQSGGRTLEGADKLHLWWQLNEPASSEDLALLCRLRGEIADKVGGDRHFRSAHQPIRVAGSVYHKGGQRRLVSILAHDPSAEVDLDEFASRVAAMPPLPGSGIEPAATVAKPRLDAVLITPVREGDVDEWSRFQGVSAAIGHYIRLMHEARLSREDGWEAICQYNEAMLRPPWPLDRLRDEAHRIWRRHVTRHGPAREPVRRPAPSVPAHTLGALLDDDSPMPDDILAPRLLTPGSILVLGGAPKVGKSDFLINLLVHAAAGVPFLGFIPPRPLRIFYLQAEIQYHYLRERLRRLKLDPAILAFARDNLVVTPKLQMLLDDKGVELVTAAIREQFPDASPDIICMDPLRNLFDGGPEGLGENDNSAMMFFLQNRVEQLRDDVAPDAGLILCHHTKKMSKKQLEEDSFMALSGASALRSYYSSGMIMFRPEEEKSERRLVIELRNGAALDDMLIDKVAGRWVALDPHGERLVRQQAGAKLDTERVRRHDVIVGILHDQALEGKMYTAAQFSEMFENQSGLGGKTTIRDRIRVLTSKGDIKFTRNPAELGLPYARSKWGYLVTEGMTLGPPVETVDTETGEITNTSRTVLPTHYKSPQSGALLEVENPEVWVYPLDDDAEADR